jgi:hypothetical protein
MELRSQVTENRSREYAEPDEKTLDIGYMGMRRMHNYYHQAHGKV